MQKIIHQFWIGPYAIPDRDRAWLIDIVRGHKQVNHILWYDGNIPEMSGEHKQIYDINYKLENFNICVDLVKLYIVYHYGGIAMDIDYVMHRSLDDSPILESRGFFLHDYGELGRNISPCFFGANKGDELISYMLSQANLQCSWFGPDWYGSTIRKYYSLGQQAGHNELGLKLTEQGYIYLNPSLRDHHFSHHGLGSWTPEYQPKRRLRTTEHPVPELFP